MASLFAPRYVLLAAVAVYAIAVGSAFLERRAAGVDTDALVAAAIRISGAPADRAAAMEPVMRPMIANYPMPILLGLGIGSVLLTTVFFLAFKVVEAGLTWGTVFAATIYGMLAQAVARLVLLVPLSAARPPVAEEIVQGTFLATNVGAVLSPESAPWLRALGGSLDALTILFLFVLVAVLGSSGRSKASDSALGITVAVCFALWLVVRVGWSLAFGR